jgi:hypothetical protein
MLFGGILAELSLQAEFFFNSSLAKWSTCTPEKACKLGKDFARSWTRQISPLSNEEFSEGSLWA